MVFMGIGMRRRIVFIGIGYAGAMLFIGIRMHCRGIGMHRRIAIHRNKDTPAHPIPINSNTPVYPYSYEYQYDKRIGIYRRHEDNVSYSCKGILLTKIYFGYFITGIALILKDIFLFTLTPSN